MSTKKNSSGDTSDSRSSSLMYVASWCSACFLCCSACLFLDGTFCHGDTNLTCLHCLQHSFFELITSIYIILSWSISRLSFTRGRPQTSAFIKVSSWFIKLDELNIHQPLLEPSIQTTLSSALYHCDFILWWLKRDMRVVMSGQDGWQFTCSVVLNKVRVQNRFRFHCVCMFVEPWSI